MKWKSKIKVNTGLMMMCTLLSVPGGLQAQKLPSEVMTILQSEASFQRFYATRTEFQQQNRESWYRSPSIIRSWRKRFMIFTCTSPTCISVMFSASYAVITLRT